MIMSALSPLNWPVLRQLRAGDAFGRDENTRSRKSRTLTPRNAHADRVVQSVCPFCAVGCGQRVYVKDERVIQIEGDPDSPISRGRLCPKGSASEQLVNSASRCTDVLYRAPHATEWQKIDLDTATDMIADRFVKPGARAGRTSTNTAIVSTAPWASPDWAERRWTMRKTTSLRNSLPPQGQFSWKTRPAYDTLPRFPVWDPPLAVAAQLSRCRIWRMLTSF